jgi:hypothetical protein
MNRCTRAFLSFAGLAAPALLAAQASDWPKVIVIGREVVKPARNAAHAKNEVAWARAGEAAKYPDTYVAMNAMSGPNESWFIYTYPSMAEWEKLNREGEGNAALNAVNERYAALDADMLNNIATTVAGLRDDLSYNNGRLFTSCRYMTVARVVVRIGHGQEFADARRMVKAAAEKSKAPQWIAVYQVAFGAPAGTYLVMSCQTSLAELDTDSEGPAFAEALGGPDVVKKLRDLRASFQSSVDAQIFAFAPQMSVVPKEWGAADAFWKPKALPKKAP